MSIYLQNNSKKKEPINEGRATQAGPGPENSAAMGPRRFVGVQGRCVSPPISAGRGRQKR